MSNKTTRIWTAMVAVALALSLLLTACGKSGETPTGDNTTPGTSTPGVTDTQTPTPDDTTEPDNTPSTAEPSAPGTSEMPTETEEPKYNMPPYDEAAKAELDEYIAEFNFFNIDIENIINEVYEKYGKYINVNITKDAIRVGIVTGGYSAYYKSDNSNLTGISPETLKKVNDFLADNGEDELDGEIPEQNIAALWLAASLYYDPDFVHENDTYKDDPCNDIAMAFGLARANNSREGDAEIKRDAFWSVYVSLYGGPVVIADYQ